MGNKMICPKDKAGWECVNYWTDAGYRFKRDFTYDKKTHEITAKTQMIIAKDSLEFGFRKK